MTNDNFDFDAFMKRTMEAGDSDLRREQMIQDVTDKMESTMAELSPRIYAVMKAESMRDIKDLSHHNALMNALVFTTATWLAACLPPKKTPESEAAGDAIVQLTADAVRRAVDARHERSMQDVVAVAQIGDNLLLKDSNATVMKVLEANTAVLKLAVERLNR